MFRFFVSIASYKDPELQYTINSVLENASVPSSIRIVVCQQDDEKNFISSSDSNVEFINVNYIDSQGVCWARYNINTKYNNEPYFVQLDSHCALIKNWDTVMLEQINIAKSTGSKKVIFAAYPTSYNIINGERVFRDPYHPRTVLRNDNVFKFHAGTGGDNNFNDPIPSPYLNAGFMFGDGSFCNDCIYDPEIYFEGEELLNTVKAFTHGYDLFNPSKHICWHLYKEWNTPQQDRDKWSLHHSEQDDRQRPVRHWERNKIAEQKLVKIFSGQMPEVLGNQRTLADFEAYIGRPLLKDIHEQG
jgi:hypothetical protein